MDRKLALQDLMSKMSSTPTQLALWAVAVSAGAGILAILVLLYLAAGSFAYEPSRNTSKQQSISAPYSISTITNNHLFGKADHKSVEQLSLPETRQALQLRGAFTAVNPKLASAIIEDRDGNARHFRVGAHVQGSISLYAVYGDRVILSDRGQLETLYFPSAEEIAQMRLSSGDSANDTPDPNTAAGNIRINEQAKTEEERNALIRKRLEELRNRIRRQ